MSPIYRAFERVTYVVHVTVTSSSSDVPVQLEVPLGLASRSPAVALVPIHVATLAAEMDALRSEAMKAFIKNLSANLFLTKIHTHI